jgi:branched-chain amino acid transport system ATP-binding protein
MKTVLGLVKPTQGQVVFNGERIDRLDTSEIISRGIAVVPEARRIFPRMTVLENLELGAFVRRSDKAGMREDRDRVLELFPRLKERQYQLSGTLSGGEQQMLAMGRALMSRPKLLCMDEPSMGLAPQLVEQVFDVIQGINRLGTTIFVVEQNANMALSIADRGFVLQTGQVVLSGRASDLLGTELIRKAYLGETWSAN